VGIVFFLGGLVSPALVLGGSSADWQAALAQWPLIPLGEVLSLLMQQLQPVVWIVCTPAWAADKIAAKPSAGQLCCRLA